MDCVPIPSAQAPDPALPPLPTTRSVSSEEEPIPVCLALSSSTLIGLEVYLDAFIREVARHTPTGATARTYGKRGRAFLAWLAQHRHLRRLDRACLDAYRADLDRRFANVRTKNGYLTAVRRFLAWLARFTPGLVDPGAFARGWPASRQHTRRHLPVEDATRLLAALESDPRQSPLTRARNVAIAYLMLKTGLRTIEVSRARIEHLQDFVPGAKWKLWVHGKGRASADEFVQIVREVYDRIQAYLALRPGPLHGPDPLFATTACYDRGGGIVTPEGRPLGPRTIHRIITDGLLLAGAKRPGIVVHSLRHSAATYALLNQAHPTQVQRMMRHRHYATTEVYVEEVQRLIAGAEDKVTQL
jgi:integrase/recombinase XerC